MFTKNKYVFCMLHQRRSHKWIRPYGYETGIKVYSCITQEKQPLIVKNKNFVTWYTCGPTVYDSSHIGHASSFIKFDIIQRILKEYFKLNLITVMNITDIDDKIILKSNELGVSVQDVARQYEKEFWQDMDSLHVNRPNCVLRVTENINVIIQFIEKLVNDKMAYVARDNSVYLDLNKYGNKYGKLQNIVKENIEPVNFKRSRLDFVLWKANKPNEIFWQSPWGTGRPGWHIECSALASLVFGSEIDVHAGGIDLKFPHHENEEAQSCIFHNKSQWVNYWLHTGHLHLKNSEKMSKSLKNTISISSVLKDTTPQIFRMACVMSHYRSSMEFSSEFLTTATNLLNNYINFINSCDNYINGYIKADINDEIASKLIIKVTDKIYNALTDDFNTPLMLKHVSELVSNINSMLHSSKTTYSDHKSVAVMAAVNIVVNVLNILGVNIKKSDLITNEHTFVNIMNILNNFRQDVRNLAISTKDAKILELCDDVRDDLKQHGIKLQDHGKLSSWSK